MQQKKYLNSNYNLGKLVPKMLKYLSEGKLIEYFILIINYYETLRNIFITYFIIVHQIALYRLI